MAFRAGIPGQPVPGLLATGARQHVPRWGSQRKPTPTKKRTDQRGPTCTRPFGSPSHALTPAFAMDLPVQSGVLPTGRAWARGMGAKSRRGRGRGGGEGGAHGAGGREVMDIPPPRGGADRPRPRAQGAGEVGEPVGGALLLRRHPHHHERCPRPPALRGDSKDTHGKHRGGWDVCLWRNRGKNVRDCVGSRGVVRSNAHVIRGE